MPSPIAIHEATHAVVSRHLGLLVKEVRVRGQLITPRYCETLYGIPAGTPVPGTGCILSDDCLERDAAGVLVAMAAPSCIQTGDTGIDYYAGMEAGLAAVFADQRGLSSKRIFDQAHEMVLHHEKEILLLAERLDTEGVILGDDL